MCEHNKKLGRRYHARPLPAAVGALQLIHIVQATLAAIVQVPGVWSGWVSFAVFVVV
jgi:hypothetical protein